MWHAVKPVTKLAKVLIDFVVYISVKVTSVILSFDKEGGFVKIQQELGWINREKNHGRRFNEVSY